LSTFTWFLVHFIQFHFTISYQMAESREHGNELSVSTEDEKFLD